MGPGRAFLLRSTIGYRPHLRCDGARRAAPRDFLMSGSHDFARRANATVLAQSSFANACAVTHTHAMPKLILHPTSSSTSSGAVTEIVAEAARSAPGLLVLRYAVLGRVAGIALPAAGAPARSDGLWRHTCFEAFVRGPGETYCEFNVAPSGQWAAWRFSGHRQGMTPLPVSPPVTVARRSEGRLEVAASFALGDLPEARGGALWRVGLSAVIEEAGGRLSYWALRHPAGEPDFHHPDCFALELPRP